MSKKAPVSGFLHVCVAYAQAAHARPSVTIAARDRPCTDHEGAYRAGEAVEVVHFGVDRDARASHLRAPSRPPFAATPVSLRRAWYDGFQKYGRTTLLQLAHTWPLFSW